MHFDAHVISAAAMLVVAIVAAGAALLFATRRQSIIERRLRELPATEEVVLSPGLSAILSQRLAPVARMARPVEEEQLSNVRQQLAKAGFRRDAALQLFLVSKVLLAVALAIGFGWYNARRAEPFTSTLLFAVVALAAGYYAPNVWLWARIGARQREIERALPDALDLIVTCVEAGLGLDGALQRVARETRLSSPVLGDELEVLFLEIKAGMPRTEAFRRLADRTGVLDLKSLAATLTQTEMFGTSVGLALRVQAEGIRTRRMYRAEERAGYVAVKMTLPLVAFILPTLFILVVGPAIINIAQAFFPGSVAR